MKKLIIIAVMLTFVALGFRLWLAVRLPNDEPGDAKIYALIANNVLDHHLYSTDEEEPRRPTYIRVPGYPLFLVGVYALFGKDNNQAVRIIQAFIDTFTCWLIALLGFVCAPANWSVEKRRRAMPIALTLAALCPFTAIYVTVLLTEVWTMFLVTLAALASIYALKSARPKRALPWWIVAGLSGGMATMFRPDSPLFVAGIGITLTIIGLGDAFRRWRNQQTIQAPITNDAAQSNSKNSTKNSEPSPWPVIGQTMLHGMSFSIAFCIILLPWTLRNERVLRVFMPIAPASASMPDEFVPAGYNAWLRTWVDNWYYTEKADWPLGERPIFVDELPAYAFDSEDEKAQVAQLLNRYNNPESKEQPTVKKIEGEDQTDQGDQVQSDDETSDDEEEDQESDGSDESEDENATVKMTPEIDAAFAQLAHERIKRHPFRTYFLTPLSRARHLWFSTHSQYYPFSGDDLFPNDGEHHQKFWLPCFKGIVWIYTIFSFAGVILLWGQREARRWLLLLALLMIPRFVYLTSLQNPEPRYVVEFFPLVLACASLALAAINRRPNP